jgi:hypothetical protein
VNSVLRFTTKRNWAKDSAIQCLIRSFIQESLTIRRVVMEWDLSVVLKRLSGAPFEPMETVDFRFVTYKALFLLALASIKRRSELHACTWKSAACTRNEFSVQTDPSFVFKTAVHVQNRSAMGKIVIEGLKSRTTVKRDMFLCPVRAMKWYMNRSASPPSRRFKGQVCLFCPVEKAKKDVTQQTISAWLRNTIVMCLKLEGIQVPQVRVTAHSVRRAGASLAFLGNTPISEILMAGTWKVESTFLHYYLADVAPKVDGKFRLGPIAAAGSIVAAPRRQ